MAAVRESTETLARVHAPKLATAITATDLKVAGRKAVPIQLALDAEKKPAIVDVEEDNEQAIGFTFDPAEHRGVYVVEGYDPGAPRILLHRMLPRPDGRSVVVYQDNLMPDLIYLPPREFRLVRDEESPFLPTIQFVPMDSISTAEGEDGEAEVLFRVIVTYRLEPWHDPEVIDLARANIDLEDLRFSTVVPRDASLTLDLDFLQDAQQRPEATIDFEHGITDHFELDNGAFTQLWAQRLLDPNVGIAGSVEFRMLDGSLGRAEVHLSLWDESDDLFDVSYPSAVEGAQGQYSVWVRNRVESPVKITELPNERLDGDVVAMPLDRESLLDKELLPGERVEVRYQVNPADAVVDDIDPMILGRVKPDGRALLPLLLSRPGYASLGFSLTVRAAERVFDPPAGGGEPIVGLLVEFDDGTELELTPEEPEEQVTLVGRLVDQIMGTEDDRQRYFYRVTNLLASGEGARTSWEEGEGVEALEVAAARGDFALDF